MYSIQLLEFSQENELKYDMFKYDAFAMKKS